MKQTNREYENMANAILATFEFQEGEINEYVKPAYLVKIKEGGKIARFECHYVNEDEKDDSRYFNLQEKDSMTKLISYVQDDYHALKTIEPNY